ncbi:MAG: hypothetical protein AVO35_09055 [Candidatus Aegiribacteria sp. MLS_C]|nr:MAG: hypothetical protein AVO35_09055 [Candidatus Aegiribacteria sp. MLS_C]
MYPEIRLARPSDIPAMLEIEGLSFSCPWGTDALEECMDGRFCRTWSAVLDGRTAGYVSSIIHDGGVHIVNLAVHPESRRMGLATALLETAEGWGGRLGASYAFLEVRAGSLPARKLYGERGYLEKEHLRNYYPDGEDGLLLFRAIEPDYAAASVALSILRECGEVPEVGVVLGSGLGWLADEFGRSREIEYGSILNGEAEDIPGHPGMMVVSDCGRFVFLLGRRHHYQGYTGAEIPLLPGVLGDLGTVRWILTSSSGAVDESLVQGQAVLFSDHVNFTGCVPPSSQCRLGPSVYSSSLRAAAMEAASECGVVLREGLFACVSGPAYETSAEIGFLRRHGFSTVSMSTVPEALYLSSMGLEVAALSLVTNAASPGAVLTHEEVLSSQTMIRSSQGAFMSSFLRKAASVEIQ